MDGYTHKTTALALQNRKLVVVSKKSGTWSAEVAPRGHHYLQHGTYPDAGAADGSSRPKSRFENCPGAADTQTRSPDRSSRIERSTSLARRPSAKPVRRLSVTEQLIADVIAAGGELHVERSYGRGGVNWESRVASAIRFDKVPEGKLLVVDRGKSWSDLVIRLQDPPEWMTVALAPIAVADSLRRPHQVVTALKVPDSRLSVTSSMKNRALRLIQGLVKAAEERGYVVSLAKDSYISSDGRKQMSDSSPLHVPATRSVSTCGS